MTEKMTEMIQKLWDHILELDPKIYTQEKLGKILENNTLEIFIGELIKAYRFS